MKIEILNKQREDLLKQFRKLTDPYFQPISVREDSEGVFIGGREVKIVVNGKTDLIIDDTSAGIKWIEERIKRLSEIIEEL